MGEREVSKPKGLDEAMLRVRAFLDERGPDRPNVIKTAGPRAVRYGKPRLRADDLMLILDALDAERGKS